MNHKQVLWMSVVYVKNLSIKMKTEQLIWKGIQYYVYHVGHTQVMMKI